MMVARAPGMYVVFQQPAIVLMTEAVTPARYLLTPIAARDVLYSPSAARDVDYETPDTVREALAAAGTASREITV